VQEEGRPLCPWEIAEKTSLAIKTVKNTLTGLHRQGAVEPTGDKKGRTERLRLIVPASLPYKKDRDGDAGYDDRRALYGDEGGAVKAIAAIAEWMEDALDHGVQVSMVVNRLEGQSAEATTRLQEFVSRYPHFRLYNFA